jgi:hypothetical protein
LFGGNLLKRHYLAVQPAPAPSYDAQYGVQWQIYISLGVLAATFMLAGIWLVFTAQFVRKNEFSVYKSLVDAEIKSLAKDTDSRFDKINLQLVEVVSQLISMKEINAINNESMGGLINSIRTTLEAKFEILSSQVDSSPASRAMLEEKLNSYGEILQEILTEQQRGTYKL